MFSFRKWTVFRIWYGTTYTTLFMFIALLTAIPPAEQVARLFKADRTPDIFGVSILYVVTWVLCIMIYFNRIFTTRAVLAGIPKSFIPVGTDDVVWSTRRMVMRQWKRAAVLAWETRPRKWDCDGPTGAIETDRYDKVDQLLNGRKRRRSSRPWSSQVRDRAVAAKGLNRSRSRGQGQTPLQSPLQSQTPRSIPTIIETEAETGAVAGTSAVADPDIGPGMSRQVTSPSSTGSANTPGRRQWLRSRLQNLRRSSSAQRSGDTHAVPTSGSSPAAFSSPLPVAPWGRTYHAGWAMGMESAGLTSEVEYAAVVAELPILIEGQVVGLASQLTGILFGTDSRADMSSSMELPTVDAETVAEMMSGVEMDVLPQPFLVVTAPSLSSGGNNSTEMLSRMPTTIPHHTSSPSQPAARSPIITPPDPRIITLLQRPSHVSVREYLLSLTHLGLIQSPDAVDLFLGLYEFARFSPPGHAVVTAAVFDELIETSVAVMSSVSVHGANWEVFDQLFGPADDESAEGGDGYKDRYAQDGHEATDEVDRYDDDDNRFFDGYISAHPGSGGRAHHDDQVEAGGSTTSDAGTPLPRFPGRSLSASPMSSPSPSPVPIIALPPIPSERGAFYYRPSQEDVGLGLGVSSPPPSRPGSPSGSGGSASQLEFPMNFSPEMERVMEPEASAGSDADSMLSRQSLSPPGSVIRHPIHSDADLYE